MHTYTVDISDPPSKYIHTQIYLNVKGKSVPCYLCSIFSQEYSVGKFHMAQVLIVTVVMLLAIESIYSESVVCGS
jgi:hypothetical protein